VNMGYLSVKTIVDHLKGKPVPRTVDTGVLMVTVDNLDDPAIRAVIDPEQAK
jgi:ribose transport system substrate-binding protein